MTFTASSGGTVAVDSSGRMLVADYTRVALGEGVTRVSRSAHIDAEMVPTLREFFQAERDEELGRWRWPDDPDFVVYAEDDGVHNVVNEKEHPTTGTPYAWVRARVLGGKTNMWGRVSLRFSEMDLKGKTQDGFGEDWPIGYADISPYYDKVDTLLGISGTKEGIPHRRGRNPIDTGNLPKRQHHSRRQVSRHDPTSEFEVNTLGQV